MSTNNTEMKRSDIDINSVNALISRLMEKNGFSVQYTGGNCDQWSKPMISEDVPDQCNLYLGVQFDDASALIDPDGVGELFVQWFLYSNTDSTIHIDGWPLGHFLKNHSEIL